MKLPSAIRTNPRALNAPPSNVKNILMVQEAEGRLLNKATDLAISYQAARDKAKLTAALSSSAGEYQKLVTTLANKEAIDIENSELINPELKTAIAQKMGVDLNTLKNDKGQAFISSYEVRGIIHDYHVKKLSESGREFLGSNKSLRSKFDAGMARQTQEGANKILALDIQQEKAEMGAAGDMFYQQAVQAGDAQLAYDIIENMAEGGLWEPQKVADHVNKVNGDVQYGKAINDLTTGDPMTIRGVQAGVMSGDNQMTDQQQYDIYQKAENQLSQLNNQREKLVKDASREKLSSAFFQFGSEGDIRWSEIDKMGESMTPSDRITLINAKRAQANSSQATKDDPLALRRLSVMVGRLAIEDGTPRNIRKENVTNALHEAMGWNPITEAYTGSAQLSSASYLRLLNEVNNSTERVISDPLVEMQIDKAWRQLTGGSKDSYDGSVPENAILASEYEYDILEAALSEGASFDVKDWHRRNWRNYKNSNLSKAKFNVNEQRLLDYAVPKNGARLTESNVLEDLDKHETVQKIKEALKSGSMSEAIAIDLLDYVEANARVITED